MLPSTHRACALVVSACVSLALVPRPGLAAPAAFFGVGGDDRVSPASAADARKPVQEQARNLRVSGDPAGAASHLAAEGARLKDPVLFLDAADALKEAGAQARDVALVESAIEHASTANDMLRFLGDDRASKSWQPVAEDHRKLLLSRLDSLVSECRTLIQEIRSDSTEPEPTAIEDEDSRSAKPGRILIIAGTVALGLGVAALGLGAAGIGIGASAQNNVNDATVYGEEFDEFDSKGRTGNLLAYVGFPLAAVGIGAGAALLIIGLKKKRAAGGTDEVDTARSLRVTPALARDVGGVLLSGRF